MASIETRFAYFVWISTIICVTLVVIPSVFILFGKFGKSRMDNQSKKNSNSKQI